MPDKKHDQNRQLVQLFKHRYLYNVNEQNESTASLYQEAQCIEEYGRRPEVNEFLHDLPLNWDDEDCHIVDAAEDAWLMNQHPPCADEDSDASADEDDIVMEYLSEDEVAPL